MAHDASQHPSHAPRHRISSYWERTQWPLQCLYFLMPLLVAYEVGTLVFAQNAAGTLPRIRAEVLLNTVFEQLGVTSFYLPPLIVVAVLLTWHLIRRDAWGLEWPLYGFMLVESVVLALPLLVFSAVLFREPVAQAATLWSTELGKNLLLSLGAGLYEELVFRLILIALLHMLLVDLLALPAHWGAALAVLLSATAFGLYHFDHFDLLQWDLKQWRLMLFYTGAGVYFAAVYVLRGFGIVAACHAIYDVVVVTATHLHT